MRWGKSEDNHFINSTEMEEGPKMEEAGSDVDHVKTLFEVVDKNWGLLPEVSARYPVMSDCQAVEDSSSLTPKLWEPV